MLFEKFADDYARFRPDYPANLIESIVNRFQLSSNSRILDLACGTGNLTRQLREITHSPVFGIDLSMIMLKHNRESRIACAKAEALPVKASMFDTVLVGQAFHWFDRDAARAEFARILNAGGWVALVWNERTVASHFGHAYETMLGEHCRRSRRVDHREIDGAAMDAFFGAGRWEVHVTPNRQSFDFDGLRGRLLSSSYTPEPGTPGHEPLMAALRAVFDAHAEHGKVTCHYATKAYVGQLT